MTVRSVALIYDDRVRPETTGVTATVGRRRSRNVSVTPGSRRMGVMLAIGLLGAMRTTSAARSAARTPGAGRAEARPRTFSRSTARGLISATSLSASGNRSRSSDAPS